MKFRSLVLAVLILIIQGCASPQPKSFVSDFEILENTSFTLEDIRSESEKSEKKSSSNVYSCDYGIMRIGDEDVVPNKIDYLTTRLEKEVGIEKLSGKSIQINQYDIYLNYQLNLRASFDVNDYVSGGSELTGMIAGLFSSFQCWARDNYPGGYDLSKNTMLQPVGLAQIKLTIEDREFASRVEFIPDQNEQNLAIAGTSLIRAVDSLILQLNETL